MNVGIWIDTSYTMPEIADTIDVIEQNLYSQSLSSILKTNGQITRKALWICEEVYSLQMYVFCL